MLFDGCQGKKGTQIQEKVCPNCGNTVEILSCDASAACEKCGFIVYNDLIDCVQRCSKARQCVGQAQYERLMAARKQWEAQMNALQDDDQW